MSQVTQKISPPFVTPASLTHSNIYNQLKYSTMMYLTIGLFALAAVTGLAILIKWLMKKEAPKAVIYSHGIVAAVALVLLVIYALQNPGNFPKISIGLFVAAAIGGFYMFIRDLKKKTSPLAIAFTHALLAVGGFVALLFFVFS
jgi:hypothetical protein